jgi:type II secretory pathway component PulL
MVFEVGLIVVLIGIVGFQGWQLVNQRSAFENEKQDLLNRLMARDFAQYVQAEVVRTQAERPDLPENREEQGIPV